MANDITVYTSYPEAHIDERGRYYDGQFLSSQDFVDEQRYHVDRLRRALDHLTVSGVAEGLDLTAAGAYKLKLSPGVAIDGVGRQLVVLAGRDVDVPKDIPGGVADVSLYYAEVESRVQGGSSDEDGTRGATRWRELPALEFYAAGQNPTRPDGVPLARIKIAGDGAVTFDPATPRRTTGLRLPSTSPNAPVLRAGGVRPNLLALAGDLQIVGRLGVGTDTPESELDVRGTLRLGHLSQRAQSFKVEGDAATYYPVLFRDTDWTCGTCVLEIHRTAANADGNNTGVLFATLRWHAADGQGAELFDVEVVQTRRLIASARPLKADKLLVVWLRGGATYSWRARNKVELADANAAGKTFGGEKLDTRASAEPAFDRDRFHLGNPLDRDDVRGSLAVSGPLIADGEARFNAGVGGDLKINAGSLTVARGASLGDKVVVTRAEADQLQLWRPKSASGGVKMFLELFQEDQNPAATPETFPAIRFHHGNRFWHRIEARADGFHLRSGDLANDEYRNLNAATITANNELKALKATTLSDTLSVAKTAGFSDKVTVTRLDGDNLLLVSPKSILGGAKILLELKQEDSTTPDTYPAIRLHHTGKYWHRIEARQQGVHIRTGDPAKNDWSTLFAGDIVANTELRVTGAATLSDTLSVTKQANFASWAKFNDQVTVDRASDNLLLVRAKTNNTGGNIIFLELRQDDPDNKIPEVGTAIRFHHSNKYWHRIEGRSDGLHVREGGGGSNDYHALFAGDVVANSMHVVTGRSERLRMIRGTISGTGTIANGEGWSVSKDNSCWKVSFNTAFADLPSVVATQQYPNNNDGGDGGNTRDNAVIVRVTKGSVWIKTGESDGSQSDRRCHFIAVGP